jgi:predicted ATPase
MCALSFWAQGLWGQGLLDQAHRMAFQSMDDARDLGHILSLAHALQRGGMNMMLLGDTESCRAIADELYSLAERNKFPWQLSDAVFFRGWLAASAGDQSGIEQMTHAVNQPFNPGFRLMFLLQLAEQALRAGQADRAVATLAQAGEELHRTGCHFGEPDILRLRGEASLAQSPNNQADAERYFREATALAAAQACLPLELRAARSLAQLLSDNGRRDEARDVLTPVYAAFTEGFTWPDLQAAKALLAELS